MSTTPPIRWRRTLAVLAVAPSSWPPRPAAGRARPTTTRPVPIPATRRRRRRRAPPRLLRQRHPRRRRRSASRRATSRTSSATPTLTTQVFNAGPAAVEALFAGALDATYIGPNPAINAFGQSDGEAIRIIAGATSGGAQLVVREGIDSAEDLKGTTLATPQLGNTQDVALRAWLDRGGAGEQRRAAAAT